LMGDEVRRTQKGNNNAYCQDNEISWFDWSLLNRHADLHRFLRLLIGRRLLRDLAPELQRMTLAELLGAAKKSWHGVKLNHPDWSRVSHAIAISVELPQGDLHFYVIFNAYWEALDFELPQIHCASQNPWRRWIDTFLDPPLDITEWRTAAPIPGFEYRAGPRSAVVLWAQKDISDGRTSLTSGSSDAI